MIEIDNLETYDFNIGDIVQFKGSRSPFMITRMIWYATKNGKVLLADGIYLDGCGMIDCMLVDNGVCFVEKIGSRPDITDLIFGLEGEFDDQSE